MRLFIAFGVSDETGAELSSAQRQLEHASLNPVKSFHLTLKFLGDVDERKLKMIKERLEKVSFKSFDACLYGMGVFPSENKARVIWAGVEPEDRINSLQKQVEDSLNDLFPEDRRFHPHITIARVKAIEDRELFRKCLRSIRIKKKRFTVKSFSLIRSTLTNEGPQYEVLQEYPAKDL